MLTNSHCIVLCCTVYNHHFSWRGIMAAEKTTMIKAWLLSNCLSDSRGSALGLSHCLFAVWRYWGNAPKFPMPPINLISVEKIYGAIGIRVAVYELVWYFYHVIFLSARYNCIKYDPLPDMTPDIKLKYSYFNNTYIVEFNTVD